MSLDLTLTFDGHRVRMVGTPQRPEWIARDVCRVLHLHNTSMAVTNAGVVAAEKGISRIDTPGGPQEVGTVTEPGLWKLVMASRKPAAQRFKAWLASEVIPSIRKHGCYPPPTAIQPATREQQLAAAVLLAQEVIAEKDARLAVVEPKAEVYDEVMSAGGTFSVAEAANLLARPHRPMGEKRLFAFMRAHGIAQADNRPYQDHIDAGRFVVVDKAWKDSDAERHAYFQTRVTQKGVEYLLRRLDAVSGQLSLLPSRSVQVSQ